MAAQPMINGTSYSWSQIEVKINGISGTALAGITSIEYQDEQKVEYNYGANDLPISRGHGNVVASASMTLHMDDIEVLRSTTDSGRLSDIGQFDVIVSFNHPQEAKIVTHTIKNCVFNENGVSASQDDTIIEKQLNLNPSHIQWKVGAIIGLGRLPVV